MSTPKTVTAVQAQRNRAARLYAMLQRAERALAGTREHNPRDLGPSETLKAIRDTIAEENPAAAPPRAVVCQSPNACPRHRTGTEYLCGPCREITK